MRAFTASFSLMLLLIAVPLAHANTGEYTARPFKGDAKPKATWVFNFDENTHREPTTFEGISLVGFVLGFACLAVFLIIAAAMIIYDEVKRHKTYQTLIDRDIEKLKARNQNMVAIEEEF